MASSEGARRLFFPLAAALLLAFLAQGIAFIRTNTPTVDEPGHLVAGYINLRTGDLTIGGWHPPLPRVLAAAAVYLIQRPPVPEEWRTGRAGGATLEWLGVSFLEQQPGTRAQDTLAVARTPSLVLGALTVMLVGLWARRLWGDASGLLAMALAAFEPSLVAHSSLVTQDGPLTFFIFLSCYLGWRYATDGRLVTWLAMGMAVGGAMMSKFSAPVVLPMLAVGLGLDTYARRRGWGHVRKLTLLTLVCGGSVPFIVIAGYGLFNRGALRGLDHAGQWVSGLRQQLVYHRSIGHLSFLFGEYSQKGWAWYFAAAMLFKLPLGSLFFFFASLFARHQGAPLKLVNVGFLVVAPLVYVVAITMAHIDLGVRLVLPAFPFLFVVAGRCATFRFGSAWRQRLWIGLPVAWNVVSTLRVAPHSIAYFNELAGGPIGGPTLLSDSNVDWGQDLGNLAEYVRARGNPPIYLLYFGTDSPSYYGLKTQTMHPSKTATPIMAGTTPELMAVSVFHVASGSVWTRGRFSWLRDKTPIARIGYSINVYDITGDVPSHLELAKLYATSSSKRAARAEVDRVLALDPSNGPARALAATLPPTAAPPSP